MPRQIVATVHTKDEGGGYGPDYALIVPSQDPSSLMAMMAATQRLAGQFGLGATTPRTGALYSTEWWLRDLPLRVTWLRYDALIDGDGEEPDWMADLDDEGVVVVPDDFEPRPGDPDQFGSPENEFTSVELETVRLLPDGTLELDAVVDGTSMEFRTAEIPVALLVGR